MINPDLVKALSGLAIGSGVSRIVKGVVDNAVETESTWAKVSTFTASVGISWLVTDLVTDHVDTKIDAAYAFFDKFKESKEEDKKEKPKKDSE